MKALLTLFMVMIVSFAEKKTFCNGFEKGYSRGYCLGDEFCIEPITPICPLPEIGEDNFLDGYARGILAGKKKKCDET